MPKIDEKILKNHINERSFSPLYLLYGEEIYTVAHYAKTIMQEVVGDGNEDFNLSRFDGDKADIDEIIDACEMMPLMSEFRCVAVNDLDVSKLSDNDMKTLCQILSQPIQGTVLVLYYTGKKVGATGKWKEFLSSCEKGGCTLKLSPLSPAELQKLLCKSAANSGCMMNLSTASYLVETCGDALTRLRTELDKLCAYCNGREIKPEDIDLMCSRNLTSNAFDMVRAINKGSASQALSLLDELFYQRIEPIMILGALSSSYVAMYRAWVAQNERVEIADFAKKLKVKNPKQLSVAASNLKGMSLGQLDNAMEILAQADIMLKSSGVDRRTVIEQTIVKLIENTKRR